MLKKSSFVSILIVLAIIISGCGGASNNVQPSEKVLNISWAQDVGNLNPHLYSPSQMFAQDFVYESLVEYGEGGVIKPHLAESWTISPDGKVYTFKLQQGVKFSDGSEFNAAIAKKNFDAVLANRDGHKWLELINQIEGVEAVDENTIEITFKNPYYPALQELSLIRPLRFLGEAGFPDDGKTSESIKAPIGTGPWALSEYKQNEYAVFVKNQYYWGAKPKIDKVVVKIIPDEETRAIAFEKQEIDLIFGSGLISLDSFRQFRDSGKYQTMISNPLNTNALALNSNRGSTGEQAVRIALQHGVNKQSLIDNILYGTEVKADTLFSPQFPYCDLGLQPYAYDVEKAKDILESAGWVLKTGQEFREKNGQLLELELCFDSADNVQKAFAEALQGEYKKIGVKLKLVGEERQSYLQRQKDGNFHLIFGDTWGAPYDPHSLVSSMRTPSHADYQAQAGLPMKAEIDEKITEVLLSTDEQVRQELYRYILGTLHEQAVYLPLSYGTNIAVAHKNITGVSFDPQKNRIPLVNVDIK
ncbi:MAG: nickel ABC transporter substrate-binding protein [Bacillota bacterium]